MGMLRLCSSSSWKIADRKERSRKIDFPPSLCYNKSVFENVSFIAGTSCGGKTTAFPAPPKNAGTIRIPLVWNLSSWDFRPFPYGWIFSPPGWKNKEWLIHKIREHCVTLFSWQYLRDSSNCAAVIGRRWGWHSCGLVKNGFSDQAPGGLRGIVQSIVWVRERRDQYCMEGWTAFPAAEWISGWRPFLDTLNADVWLSSCSLWRKIVQTACRSRTHQREVSKSIVLVSRQGWI